VRVVFKHYVVHPQTATAPALATCAAQKQGKFWEMEEAIWDKGWANGRMGDISEEAILKYAGEIGLNLLVLETPEVAVAVYCGVVCPDAQMLGIDVLTPAVSSLRSIRDRFRGICLTHGHEDHSGALPYVLPGATFSDAIVILGSLDPIMGESDR
jgi:glyoxylase-like metal-dependent hydrolase (beta-lactamase superfamily II)